MTSKGDFELKTKKFLSGIVSTGFALALIAGGAGAAQADVRGEAELPTLVADDNGIAPMALCSGGRVVVKNSLTSYFKRANGDFSSVSGDPGVTLALSTSRTYTVTGTVTASATVTASVAVASASATAGGSVAASYAGTTQASGSWTVPSNYKKGRLEIGSDMYKGTVTKYMENRNCDLVKQGSSATINAPRKELHFKRTKVA